MGCGVGVFRRRPPFDLWIKELGVVPVEITGVECFDATAHDLDVFPRHAAQYLALERVALFMQGERLVRLA
jgi:hypothetical protein